MHTPYSDGGEFHPEIAAAALDAGLDFVVVTDHNIWVDGVERYYEADGRRVLLLVGEEVHDVRREPQVNHCLVIGAERGMAPHAPDPQGLIDAVRERGGYTFLAHPHDPAAPAIGEDEYPWRDWEIERFAGLELWNYMSSWKGTIRSWRDVLPAVFRPERGVVGPDEETLRRWDRLLAAGKRVAVTGGSDGHAFRQPLGPWQLIIFPYEQLFRTVNTHLLLDEPLTGDFERDKPRVLEAIGRGRGWVGYDLAAKTSGFRFSAQSGNRGTMGDDIFLDGQVALQVVLPTRGEMRLIHNGNAVAGVKHDLSLTYLTDRPGAYRVEAFIPFKGRRRGWIFSNPIYVRAHHGAQKAAD